MTTVTNPKFAATSGSRFSVGHVVLALCVVGLGTIIAAAMLMAKSSPPAGARGPAIAIPVIASPQSIAMDFVARELAGAGLDFSVVGDSFAGLGFLEFEPAPAQSRSIFGSRHPSAAMEQALASSGD